MWEVSFGVSEWAGVGDVEVGLRVVEGELLLVVETVVCYVLYGVVGVWLV